MTFFFQRTSCFLHFVAHTPHKNPLLSRQKYSPLSFAFNFFYPICLPQIVYSLTKETLPLLFKVVLCHVLQVLLNFSTLGFDSICLGFKIFYIRRLYLQIQDSQFQPLFHQLPSFQQNPSTQFPIASVSLHPAHQVATHLNSITITRWSPRSHRPSLSCNTSTNG